MAEISQVAPLQVGIVSGVVCPWCIIGYKQLQKALFDAFFSFREDVSDGQVLAAVAGRVGLPVAEALEVAEDGRYAQAVREEQQIWLDKGVHAVPTFLFNQKYIVPGAQDAETFVRVLNKIQVKDIVWRGEP